MLIGDREALATAHGGVSRNLVLTNKWRRRQAPTLSPKLVQPSLSAPNGTKASQAKTRAAPMSIAAHDHARKTNNEARRQTVRPQHRAGGVRTHTTYCTSMASLPLSSLFATAIVQIEAFKFERIHRPAATCIRHESQTCVHEHNWDTKQDAIMCKERSLRTAIWWKWNT